MRLLQKKLLSISFIFCLFACSVSAQKKLQNSKQDQEIIGKQAVPVPGKASPLAAKLTRPAKDYMTVELDGVEISLDKQPVVKNGVIKTPIQGVPSDVLAEWESTSKTIILTTKHNFDKSTGLPAPKGLMRALSLNRFSTEERRQKLADDLRKNPYLEGVYIGMSWKDIEPEKGKFDFIALDALIQVIRDANLDYKLSVMPGKECPPYIYKGLKYKINTIVSNPHRPDYNQKIIVPVPWDPFYQENLKRMFSTVFGRYKNDSHFVVACLTGANHMSSEWHLPKSPEDIAQWKAIAPNYADRIRDFWIDMIDFIAVLLPDKRMALSASSTPLGGMSDQANEIVEYGIAKYPGQFMIQINQLHGNNDQKTFEAFARVMRNSKRITVGLQSLANVKSGITGRDMRQGTLEMGVYNFLQSGANYWELWDGDGADVPTCRLIYEQIKFASALGVKGYKDWLISQGMFIDAK